MYAVTSNMTSPTHQDEDDPDYIYLSLQAINGDNTQPQPFDPQLRFSETRNVPILSDASKYHLSIVRFTIAGAGLNTPIIIPSILTGANNPTNDVNLTAYSVTLSSSVDYLVGAVRQTNTFTSTKPIIWVPEVQDVRLAPAPSPLSISSGQQDVSTRYYWGLTYSHFLDLVDAAFAAALADIQTQFNVWYAALPGAGPIPTLTTKAPQMLYNPTSNLFTLYADQYGFGGADRSSIGSNADESFTMWFNNNMYGLFSNFQAIQQNNGEQAYQIAVYSALGQNTTTTGGTTYYVMVQDYPSTSNLWCPIQSIVFTTSLLPTVNQLASPPVNWGSSNTLSPSSGTPTFEPIITDVAVFQNDAHAYRTYTQYSPTAEYRLSSFLRGKTSINQVDIQCWWRNRLTGALVPLYQFDQSNCSLLIMFRKRGVYDYPHPAKFGANV